MYLLENLKWRYATKKFDPTRKVSGEDLGKIKEAIQLSASSYGFQLYKVLIIENKKIREALKKASWNQSQITDASHLMVFCNFSTVAYEHIESFSYLKAKTHGFSPEKVKNYATGLMEALNGKSEIELAQWTAKQTYLALGNLLAACAELKIDACPMEGFQPEAYNEILGLTSLGLNAAVIAPIGYRSAEDATQWLPKVRKPMETLFEEI
ncbi:NAD(P)H-dependent oxidoreductase [Parapedobacter tibetensis]|uniref:NAD(P)H-dependent oxidoreductase n=1 Tax=Parapedobacter tibetensis TaxID=2972951 RepID=UPI00214D96D9|nr:NAD(P)H-dependent oxidoreductase [Parapedobacter tibetensis]